MMNLAVRVRPFSLILFIATCDFVPVNAGTVIPTTPPPGSSELSKVMTTGPNQSFSDPTNQDPTLYPNCDDSTISLPVTKTARQDFKNALTNNGIFVYVTLHFSNLSQVFEHENTKSFVINPFVWVWALEGKGYALLTYPYDFEYLLLTTLSPGVNRVELAVPLKEEEKPCFQKKNNQDREQILARFVTDVANEAIHSFIGNKSNIYNGKEFQVCLEKRDTNSPSLFAVETLFTCTVFPDNHRDDGPIRKHNWPRVIRYTIVILVVIFPGIIFPLGINFFTCKNPPTQIEGSRWFTVGSDLPVGIKYFFFHSNYSSKWIGTIRALLACILFNIAGTLLYIVPFVAKEEYDIRKLSHFLRPFPLWHFICTLMIFLACLIGVFINAVYSGSVVKVIDECIQEGEDMKEYLDMFERFEVPEEELRKISKLHGPIFRKLRHLFYSHAHYLIRPRLWWKSLDSIEIFKSSKSIKLLAFPFLSIWFITCNLPLVRNFMMFLVLSFYILMDNDDDEEDRGKWHRPLSLTCNLILCIIFLFICMNFTAVIWCSFIFFLLLIGKIIAYTFTGLLLNYDYYLKYQYVYVLAGLAGAYMGSIHFYDKYCVLHRNILEQMFVVYEEKREDIEKLNKEIHEYPCSLETNTDDKIKTTDDNMAKDKDEYKEKNDPDENENNNPDDNEDRDNPTENEDKDNPDENENNTPGDNKGMDNPDELKDKDNHDENKNNTNPQTKKDKKVFLYIRDIPHVSHEFFDTCCEIFQPVRVQVIKFVLAMSSIFLVVQFAASVLQSVQKEVELPEVLTNFLVPLFSVGIIPFLNIITTSKEQETCKEEEKILKIKKFMRRNLEMLENGKGEYWSGMACPKIKWHPSINELKYNKFDDKFIDETKSNNKSIDESSNLASVKSSNSADSLSNSEDSLRVADLNTTQIEMLQY